MPPILLAGMPLWSLRDPFSTISHLAGALLSIVVTVVLVRRARRQGLKGRAVSIYGLTVTLAFTASALFHAVDADSSRLVLLKKLDHAAIFLVMAGTGTAIYAVLGRPWTDKVIAAMWAVTMVAMTVKMLVWPMALWMTALFYVATGWLCCIGLFAIAQAGSWRQLRLFLGGAIVLSLGAVVFATEWPVVWPGVIEGHDVFHLLVLVGVGLHFRFAYLYCTCADAFAVPEAEPAPTDLGLETRG